MSDKTDRPFSIMHTVGTSRPWGISGTTLVYMMREDAARVCGHLNAAFQDGLREGASAGKGAAKPVPTVIGGTERIEPSTHATAVIRRDAQEQPTEGKHPSSVKGVGVEEIMKVVDPLVIWDGTEIGPDGGDAEAECRARLTALLSPDKA